MSTFKHPVGPQPSGVYWRRRLIVGLVALAIVVIVVLILVRPGASNGSPTSADVPATSTSSAAPVSAAASTTIPTTATTASGAPCKPAKVTVEAVTDASTYSTGQSPALSLAITNTGTVSCKLNVGTSKQVFTITSGSEVYWKSTDCQSGAVDAEVLLQPGKTIKSSAPISWDRTRSDAATCGSKRTPVPAGGVSYHLQTSVDGIPSSATKQFILN